MSCPRCGGPTIPLFTGFACKAECDLRPTLEDERVYEISLINHAGRYWTACIVLRDAEPPNGWTRAGWWLPSMDIEKDLITAEKQWILELLTTGVPEQLENVNAILAGRASSGGHRPVYLIPR
jgi:hypothetical protein